VIETLVYKNPSLSPFTFLKNIWNWYCNKLFYSL